MFCALCEAEMPRMRRPVCLRCGIGIPGAFDALLSCATCREHPPAFDGAISPWQYAGALREALHLFKYHHHWRLGPWFAEAMVSSGASRFPLEEVDVVVPVPLHWLKRRLKGFQPVAELAEAAAAALQKPCEPSALRRRRWTATQTTLTWGARWRNVRQAFIARASAVRHRTILLIDDVLTSGATAHACSFALKDAGARRVFVLTAARTPR
jgi:predicted amidophosphoribosyltransferase